MEENWLKKFNTRIVLILVFLIIMTLMVFAFTLGQLLFGLGGAEQTEGGLKYLLWIFLLVVLVLGLLLFWNIKTRNHFSLKLKKRRILFIYSAIWLLLFLIMAYQKFNIREILVAGLIITVGMLHFFFVNDFKFYTSRILQAITIGVSLFLLQVFMTSSHYVIIHSKSFDIKDVISTFLAHFVQVIPRLIILLPIVFVFSFLITILPFGRVGSQEALDSDHVSGNNL